MYLVAIMVLYEFSYTIKNKIFYKKGDVMKRYFNKPVDQFQRKSDLPWQHPKSKEEDPRALERIENIMESSS